MSAADGDRPRSSTPPGPSRPRWPLFWKYFIVLFGAVVVTLLANGLSEALFGYRDLTESLSRNSTRKRSPRPGELTASSTALSGSSDGPFNCRGLRVASNVIVWTCCV